MLVYMFGGYYFFLRAPSSFQPESVVTIVQGGGLSSVAATLQREHIITSTFWFKVLVVLEGSQKKLIAGDYIFHKKTGLFQVTRRLITGDTEITPTKVTFPEGISSKEMTDILTSKFPSFNSNAFYILAKQNEGYLFPDTYFLYATAKPGDIVSQMRDNFTEKIKPLLPKIATSTHTLSDVIIMASILEEEVKTPTDQQIVAGILWKRIQAGIPLQVDSPFRYTLGKTSDQITSKDLQTKSPYNTYLNKGLPPTPISNPGLSAIEAALNPTATPYYFFLSDTKGNIHYAKTGAEHEANVERYLR